MEPNSYLTNTNNTARNKTNNITNNSAQIKIDYKGGHKKDLSLRVIL